MGGQGAVATYFILFILWSAILAYYLRVRRAVVRGDPLFAGLLFVLALDAAKTLIESLYFGLLWGANYDILPAALQALGAPGYLIAIKWINVLVAVLVLAWLIRRWLPRELHERQLKQLAEAELIVARRSQAELERLNADLQARGEALERLNRALTSSREATLQANRELEAFSYSVSHDLRAPLRTITGFGAALEDEHGATLDPQARKYLRSIRGAAAHMGELIDGMLALSRVTSRELNVSPLDLSSLAVESHERLARAEPDRAVEVQIQPGLRAEGDRRLMGVVLDNLLGNAWKFSRGRTPARIELGAAEKDGERAFFVRDNGAGFDPEYAHKLFGVFQRLHSAQEFEGTGIGLATVRRVIERHGGRVWAESVPGEGATFFFTLPARG